MEFSWAQCSFLLEMIIATFVFAFSMKRKTQFYKRLLCFFLPVVLVSGFIPNSIPKFFVEMLVTGAGICCCYEVSWRKAVYCANCAYALQHFSYALEAVLYMSMRKSLFHAHALLAHGADFSWEFWLCYFMSYMGTYLLLSRGVKREITYDVSVRQTWLFSTGVLAVVLILSAFVQQYLDENQYGPVLLCYLYSMLCCVFIIFLEYGIYQSAVLKNEISVIHYLWARRQEQYVTAKENIASINRKCHELKREIAKIQKMESLEMLKNSLEELQKEIQIYDAVVKTGNEVLDVVLTEKSLYCNSQQITLACVVDGTKLGFIEATDIYALFEDGLDNAVSHVISLEEAQKRQVAVTVWSKSGLLLIQIENYCEEEGGNDCIETQDDKTGYDGKSMQYLVDKYDGYMTCHHENSLFIRRISIPLPGGE